MRVELPYGGRLLPLEIPEGISVEVLRPNCVRLPPDEGALLKEAFAHPTGTPRLEEIAKPGQRVAVLIDDITRTTPTERILPLVVDRLNKAGVDDKDILVIVALGSHRPMTEPEVLRKVGPEIYGRLSVVNSEFRDRSRMTRLPGIPGAPEIWIDRRVMEADVRIGVGGILPHPAAGWSGGGKIVFPGVAGEETVAAFHLLHARNPRNMFGIVDNPVRQAMESWVAARVGLEFIVNVVMTPEGRIYRAVAGHFVEAHRRGVAFAQEVFCVRGTRQADVVVVTSHPGDLDFWQAGKGLLAADLAAQDGGTAILVAPCYEGVGPHPRYLEYQTAASAESLLEQTHLMPPQEQLPLAVAAASLRIIRRLNVLVVSEGLDPDELRRAGMTPFPTPQDALSAALRRHGPGVSVTVITHGGETVPVI